MNDTFSLILYYENSSKIENVFIISLLDITKCNNNDSHMLKSFFL